MQAGYIENYGTRSGSGMKQIYLIRHAKSSWSQPDLNDYDRPLNKRGKKNRTVIAKRLLARGIIPQRIVSSPAVRARKTARHMAKGTGFRKKNIVYDEGLYFAGFTYFLENIEKHLKDIDILFMVGHNPTVTDLAEYLTGECFFNVPTCGVVGIEYRHRKGFENISGVGSLLFFDFPKNEFR